MVHEAGTDSVAMAAFENLANQYRLPIRVSAMLSSRDPKFPGCVAEARPGDPPG